MQSLKRRLVTALMPSVVVGAVLGSRPKAAEAQGPEPLLREPDGGVRIAPGGTFDTPECYFDAAHNKLRTRSVIVAERGDSGELGFRRSGPDGEIRGLVTIDPQPIGDNTRIGLIWWEAYGTNGDFSGRSGGGWTASITVRTREVPTATARGGSMHFATTPIGKTEPQDVLELTPNGELWITDMADHSGPKGRLAVRNSKLMFFSAGAWRPVKLG